MKKDTKSTRDEHLTVKVENGRLVISIGIDTLAFATENAPGWFFQTEEGENRWVVTDPDVWADSVALVLDKEEEDGTTVIHRMFDAAFQEAIEHGYEGADEA